MTEQTITRADGLRNWAAGSHAYTAAAELLIRRAFLLNGPWVEYNADRQWWWFNAEQVHALSGELSGGERRLLSIAASLCDEFPIQLGDAVQGLDRENLSLVLAAIAHAAGTHEQSEMMTERADDGGLKLLGFVNLGPLFPWPLT